MWSDFIEQREIQQLGKLGVKQYQQSIKVFLSVVEMITSKSVPIFLVSPEVADVGLIPL